MNQYLPSRKRPAIKQISQLLNEIHKKKKKSKWTLQTSARRSFFLKEKINKINILLVLNKILRKMEKYLPLAGFSEVCSDGRALCRAWDWHRTLLMPDTIFIYNTCLPTLGDIDSFSERCLSFPWYRNTPSSSICAAVLDKAIRQKLTGS